ncbi:MAG TPA: hypothetical protein VNO55_00175 [Polyangia bacterium]|nr:hypothetical protein [Polyangia bacterium]
MKLALAMGAFVVTAALAAGCGGSSGGTGTSPDGGGSGGAGGLGMGTITWKENGATKTSSFASAARGKSAQLDMVQVTGSNGDPTALSFGIAMKPPPLVPGTYACFGASYPIVSISYLSKGASSGAMSSCSIIISTVGDVAGSHITGTFTATLPLDNGTTKTLTDGQFDLAQTVNSI